MFPQHSASPAFSNGVPQLLDQHGKPFPVRPDTGRPDGSAHPSGIAIPHAFTFVARHGGADNTYWHGRFDEAMRHAREDAEVMRRDAFLRALLQERQLAVSSLPWHLEVPDRRDAYQRRVRDGLDQVLRGIPDLYEIISAFLEAIWYGRYGVQVEWGWSSFYDRPEAPESKPTPPSPAPAGAASMLPGMPGMPPQPGGQGQAEKPQGRKRRCLSVRQFYPVSGDKIGHQYDGTPYVLVNAHDVSELGMRADEIGTTVGGRGVTLRGDWAERILLHRHKREDSDFFNPTAGDAVHGVGIRSVLFWLNWLKLEWLGNVTDFFDRVGLGFTIWKYPAGNAQAKEEAERAAQNQSGRAHVLVPLWGADGKEALTGVERVEIPTSGAEALVRLIEYIDRQIERFVVGQSGSAAPAGGGIGNEAASKFMESTKAAITQDDARRLAATLTGTEARPGLLSVIKKYTFADADFPVNFVFDVEDPESEKKLNSGRTLVDMGVAVSEEEFRAAAGYREPAAGEKIVEPPPPPDAGGGMMPGGMPGMPGMEGMAAGGGQEGGGGGDFLDVLRQGMSGEPERYAWVQKRLERISETGLPLYLWEESQTGQRRIQNVPPGSGHGKGDRKKAGGAAGGGRRSGGGLRVGVRQRALIAKALELMFPGGWVRPAGLPALCGAEPGRNTPASVEREADGTLKILVGTPKAASTVSLGPDGVVSVSLASRDLLRRALPACEAAGVDLLEAGEKITDLSERDGGLPEEVVEGNEERRRQRLSDPEALMEAADEFLPRPTQGAAGTDTSPPPSPHGGGAAAPPPSSPAREDDDAPDRMARAAEAVRFLHMTGRPEAARAVALAFAMGEDD